MILCLAILAGVAAWLVGEPNLGRFKPSAAAAAEAYNFRALNQETARANAFNGALAFGVFGGVLGLALGLAGGLARRSPGGALVGALAGLILGTLAGALPSFAVMPYQWNHRNDDPSTTLLLQPMLIHFGLWSAIGLAAGFAFGLGLYGLKASRLIEAALAGLIGAMLGTFVFDMLGAILFPLAKTVNPFSETSGTRLLARLCVAGFVALGAIRSLPPRAGVKEAGTAKTGSSSLGDL
jgi:hypothetical protein